MFRLILWNHYKKQADLQQKHPPQKYDLERNYVKTMWKFNDVWHPSFCNRLSEAIWWLASPQNATCKCACPETCLRAPQCACLPQNVSACPETVTNGFPSSSAASHKWRDPPLQQRVIAPIIPQNDSRFASQPNRSCIAAASQKNLPTGAWPDCSKRAL